MQTMKFMHTQARVVCMCSRACSICAYIPAASKQNSSESAEALGQCHED